MYEVTVSNLFVIRELCGSSTLVGQDWYIAHGLGPSENGLLTRYFKGCVIYRFISCLDDSSNEISSL